MDISNVMDRSADSVNQSRRTANRIVVFCQLVDFRKLHTVMKHLADMIKKNRGNITFAVLFALFLDQRIETADCVAFQARHRAASVKNKYQFCNVVFHNDYLQL